MTGEHGCHVFCRSSCTSLAKWIVERRKSTLEQSCAFKKMLSWPYTLNLEQTQSNFASLPKEMVGTPASHCDVPKIEESARNGSRWPLIPLTQLQTYFWIKDSNPIPREPKPGQPFDSEIYSQTFSFVLKVQLPLMSQPFEWRSHNMFMTDQ